MTGNMKIMLVMALLALTGGAYAQSGEQPTAYAYATYYVCDVATQGNMDNIVRANEAPVFDRWVEEDKLSAWGYLSHFTGGRWRRAQFHVSPTLEDALRVQAEIFSEIYSDNREGGQARAEACEAHDDYIWAVNQGTAIPADRGKASLSVYYLCDSSREIRADRIFEEGIAPSLEQFREDGKIRTWSWQSHVLGGPFRRLLIVTGDDYAVLSRVRRDAMRSLYESSAEGGREFSEICNSHEDYLWDIVHGTP